MKSGAHGHATFPWWDWTFEVLLLIQSSDRPVYLLLFAAHAQFFSHFFSFCPIRIQLLSKCLKWMFGVFLSYLFLYNHWLYLFMFFFLTWFFISPHDHGARRNRTVMCMKNKETESIFENGFENSFLFFYESI